MALPKVGETWSSRGSPLPVGLYKVTQAPRDTRNQSAMVHYRGPLPGTMTGAMTLQRWLLTMLPP